MKIKEFYIKYKRRIGSIALIGGFILDFLTLNRIDQVYDNAILLFYLILSGIGISVVQLHEARKISGKVSDFFRQAFPTFIQFAFGGLFSGFFIFYSRSASLWNSWPYILLLLAFLIGNEFIKEKYARFTLQVSVLYFLVFSYLIFSVPIVVKEMGSEIFFLSGILSLVVMGILGAILLRINPKKLKESRNRIITSIGGIFLIMNILYFTNVLPPIPLSLKDSGVYHSVVRINGGYEVLKEDRPWYLKLFPQRTFYFSQGPIYFYSSVFAPTDLKTKIVHEWQYYDKYQGRWQVTDRISFALVGGRDGGYRGYTQKSSVREGKWRIDIETDNGLVIGRKTFYVFDDKEPELEDVKL